MSVIDTVTALLYRYPISVKFDPCLRLPHLSTEPLSSAKQTSLPTLRSCRVINTAQSHHTKRHGKPDGSSSSASSEEFTGLHPKVGRKRAVDLVAEAVEVVVGVDAVEAGAAGGAEASCASSEPVSAEPGADAAADVLRLRPEPRQLREHDGPEVEVGHAGYVQRPEAAAGAEAAEAGAGAAGAVVGLTGAGGEGGGGRRTVVEAGAGGERGAAAAQAAAGRG